MRPGPQPSQNQWPRSEYAPSFNDSGSTKKPSHSTRPAASEKVSWEARVKPTTPSGARMKLDINPVLEGQRVNDQHNLGVRYVPVTLRGVVESVGFVQCTGGNPVAAGGQ